MSTQILEPSAPGSPTPGSPTPGSEPSAVPAWHGTTAGRRGRWPRRLGVAALALGLALASGPAGAVAVVALDHPTPGNRAAQIVDRLTAGQA